MKSLYVHRALDRTLSPEALEEYFAFGYVPEPRTFLKGSFKLPPAHTLLVHRGQPLPAPRQYWELPFADDAHGFAAGHGEGNVVDRAQVAAFLGAEGRNEPAHLEQR